MNSNNNKAINSKQRNDKKRRKIFLWWSFAGVTALATLITLSLGLPTVNQGSASSSISTSVSSNLESNQLRLIAVEVHKLPTKTTYTPVDTISTSGGELRLVYSDYSVKYVAMNDAMIDYSRFNTTNLGTNRITLAYSFNQDKLFTTYNIDIVPFAVLATNLVLDINSSNITLDQVVNLNFLLEPTNATYSNLVWTSSNPLVATVDSNGLVTPKNVGNVVITATLDGRLTANSNLTVVPGKPIELRPTSGGSSGSTPNEQRVNFSSINSSGVNTFFDIDVIRAMSGFDFLGDDPIDIQNFAEFYIDKFDYISTSSDLSEFYFSKDLVIFSETGTDPEVLAEKVYLTAFDNQEIYDENYVKQNLSLVWYEGNGIENVPSGPPVQTDPTKIYYTIRYDSGSAGGLGFEIGDYIFFKYSATEQEHEEVYFEVLSTFDPSPILLENNEYYLKFSPKLSYWNNQVLTNLAPNVESQGNLSNPALRGFTSSSNFGDLIFVTYIEDVELIENQVDFTPIDVRNIPTGYSQLNSQLIFEILQDSGPPYSPTFVLIKSEYLAYFQETLMDSTIASETLKNMIRAMFFVNFVGILLEGELGFAP